MIRSVEAEHSALPPPASKLEDRAERLVEALAEYHGAVDAGNAPSRDDFLQRYPEIAQELAGYLDGFDFVREIAPQLRTDEVAVNSTPTIAARATLGDFQILREIGRGGMGVVYEAEQISIGRRVALKVLPFAAMLDQKQLNRFKNEARAAGTLNHPNIVAVHAVGVERGVHYYAMQLIEGQSLSHVVEQLKSRRKQPIVKSEKQVCSPPLRGEGLGEGCTDTAPIAHLSTLPDFSSRDYFRTIAQLGIQAAEALDHAHQNGILHRDIKPANLLLDDTGKLWITDFGLARIEQDAGMTMTGDILGTLRYMSPEQALAKRVVVDHRSDIYSLGVTLYELLTLQPAYSGDDRQELLRKIAFVDPPVLRKVNAHTPQDLETVIRKSMEKNPAQRYATAQEFADDLRRIVQNQPIKAKPPTWRDHVVKWSRRHQVAMLAGIVVLAVLTLALAVSSLLIARERNAALTARNEATSQFQAARAAIDQLMSDVAKDESMNAPQMERLRKSLLTDALKFYQHMLEGDNNNAALHYEMALAQRRVGDFLFQLGRREDAAAAQSDAIRRLRALTSNSPETPEYRFTLAEALYSSAQTLERLKESADADASGINHQLAQRNCEEAARILEDLNRADPRNLTYVFNLAKAYAAWAGSSSSSAKAIDRYTRAKETLEPLLASGSATSQYKDGYAATLQNLAECLTDNGRREDGKKVLDKAKDLFRELVKENPADCDHRHCLGMTLWNSANLFPPENKADLVAIRQECVSLWEGVVNDSPWKPGFRGDLAMARMKLAIAYDQAGKSDVAREQLLKGKNILDELCREFPRYKEGPMNMVTVERELVYHFEKYGPFDDWLREAEDYRRFLLSAAETFVNDKGFVYYTGLFELYAGKRLVSHGRNTEGIEWARQGFQRAWELLQSADDVPQNRVGHLLSANPIDLDIVDLLGQFSIALYDARETQSAAEFVEALARVSRQSLECAPELRKTYSGATENVLKWGAWFLAVWPDPKLRDAELARQMALAIPETEKLKADKWRTLAVAELRCAECQEALEAIEKSIALRKEALRSASGIDWLILAMAHWQLGDQAEAKTWYSKAATLMDSADHPNEEDTDPRWSFFERRLRIEAESLLGAPTVDKLPESSDPPTELQNRNAHH